jgi:deoxyribonuclease V
MRHRSNHPCGTRARARGRPIALRDLLRRLLWTCTGRSQNIVLMLAQVGHPQDMDTGGHPDCDVCVALDVHYLGTGGARAAAVLAADATFAYVQAERTAVVPWVPPYQPGEFYLRELPPLRAVLGDLSGLGLLVVDGYADLDPGGRPGLGAHAHAEFGIPVIGVAKSRYRTASHALPVQRGSSAHPLFVTAAGMPAPDAADLVRRMAGRYRLPDALRRADTLARAALPATTLTGRQPG